MVPARVEARCVPAGARAASGAADRPHWCLDPAPEGATRAWALHGTCKHPGASKDMGG